MKRFIAVAALAALPGCTVLMWSVSLPQNTECKDYALTGLLDLGIAAAIGGIAYAEGGGTGGYVAAGVFGTSALLGMGGSIACNAHHEAARANAVYYPRGNSTPPDSLRLDPQDNEVRDATPEEMGLSPAKNAPPKVAPTDPTPPPEPVYKTGADGFSPPNRDGSSKPTQQPPLPTPPTCQLSPRIDCPQKTHCVLTEENRGVCEAIP